MLNLVEYIFSVHGEEIFGIVRKNCDPRQKITGNSECMNKRVHHDKIIVHDDNSIAQV